MARLCEGQRALEVVEEEKELHGMVGGIEVECVEGEHLVDRIVLVPSSHDINDAFPLSRTDSLIVYGEELMEDGHGIEVTDSLLEQLTLAFMDGCHCGPCVPKYKSALRKPGRARASGPGDPYGAEDRAVSFSSLEIHEFNMTLGDHPAAVSGPPVALDYSRAQERVVDLDEYERNRNPRRGRRQLKLSYRDRKGILECDRGFSTAEVNSAWAEALRIRQQRQETLQRGSLMMMWDDFNESSQRKLYRMAEAIGIHS
jgi:hypothetical protein